MTKEDAKKIVDMMIEKNDYELVISKKRNSALDDCNKVFCYAWSTKNDETNKWEHDFEDLFCTHCSGEQIIEELMECNEYMVLNATKTIFVWQSK